MPTNDIENTAIFVLSNNIGFLFQGILMTLCFQYFYFYGRSDRWLLQIGVGLSLLLETIASILYFIYSWKVINLIGPINKHWEEACAQVLKVPVMFIAQLFFFYRAWALLDKPKWALILWCALVVGEVATGEATFLLTLTTKSNSFSRPPKTKKIFRTHLILTTALDTAVFLCFSLKLASMKSSMTWSDKVVRKILLQTVLMNICFSGLALLTLTTWSMDLEEKLYGIPRELMYRCYAIGLLIALLSRSSIREMLQAPTMSIQVDIENIQEGGREPDEAVGSSQSSSIGGKSSLFSRLTGLVPRDVNKVSAPSEVVR